MRLFLIILFCSLPSAALLAQTNANLYEVDFSQLIPYVLPFYGITMIALGLFIHKLMRPNFSNKWLYICCCIGILGAGAIAYQFRDIRQTQLPEYQYEETEKTKKLSPQLQERLRAKETVELQETVSNYWVIAIPNFALLLLGLVVDRQQKKSLTT